MTYPFAVELNGESYVLSGPVVEQPVEDWGDAVRVQGQQARLDLLYRSNWKLKMSGGLLWSRDDMGESGGLWDSTLETRWADQGLVCLPPLRQDGTTETKGAAASAVGAAGTSSGFVVLYRGGGATPPTYVAQYDGSTWADVTVLATGSTGAPTRGRLIEAHRDVFYALPTASSLYKSTDGGATWASSNSGAIASLTSTQFLRSIGARLYFALSSGNVYYTVDDSAAWTNAGAHGLGTLTGLASYWDENGAIFPHLVTSGGVHRCDINGITPVLVLDLLPYGGGTDTGRGSIFWPQAASLMVPIANSQGGLLQFQVIPGQGRVVRQVGLDQAAGVPSGLQGNIVDLLPVGKWLFALVQAGANAYVFAFDGTRWHYVATRADAQVWVLGFSAVGGKPTLFLVGDNNTTTLDIDKLEHITLNPESVSGYQYAASGIADLAYFGGGLGELPTNYLRLIADVDDLSASTAGEYVKVEYGTNGAVRTTTTLGNLLSGDLDLDFGSGAGISARTLGCRLTFYRDAGNTTDSPKWRGGGIDYRKKPAVRTAWRFRVDVEASAIAGSRNTEEVISALKTVTTSVTQVTFKMPGQASTRVLAQLPWAFIYEIHDEPDPLEALPRVGLVDVLVVQMAP